MKLKKKTTVKKRKKKVNRDNLLTLNLSNQTGVIIQKAKKKNEVQFLINKMLKD